MGNRGRNAEKKTKSENKIKLHNAQKEFTRAKALIELVNGVDPNNNKFTRHRNYHVRERAFNLSGGLIPETQKERHELFESLAKGRTLAGIESLKQRFNMNENVETKVA